MLIKPLILIPFLIVSALNIFFQKIGSRKGIFFTKPLLMPLLLLFYLTNACLPDYKVALALICGFLGDLFLLLPGKKTLILAGILSFLAGHIFYIAAFLGSSISAGVLPKWFVLLLIPYAGLEIFFIKKLLPSIKSMKLPVIIYMNTILLMSFASLCRIFKTPFVSFLLTFSGSLAFILSDALLVRSMFEVNKKRNHVYVMTTYILAQLLIISGLLTADLFSS